MPARIGARRAMNFGAISLGAGGGVSPPPGFSLVTISNGATTVKAGAAFVIAKAA